MDLLKMFVLLASIFAVAYSTPRPGFGGGKQNMQISNYNEHHIVHVPYNVHTVHHHHVQKIPIVKEVPIIKHVPVYKEVHVPVIKEVHVPVHVHDDHHHHDEWSGWY